MQLQSLTTSSASFSLFTISGIYNFYYDVITATVIPNHRCDVITSAVITRINVVCYYGSTSDWQQRRYILAAIFHNSLFNMFKKKSPDRLPLMNHYQVTSEWCRYTVNLPRGHVSNDVIEVRRDLYDEEYLEVTCGDKNALLYVTRLCKGSKGWFLFRCFT